MERAELGLLWTSPSLPVAICSITWAVYTEGNYNLLLLVEIEDTAARKYFQVVRYDLGNWGTTGGGLECTADSGREMLLVSLLGKGCWWRTGLVGWRN